jgi:hypothetical protein
LAFSAARWLSGVDVFQINLVDLGDNFATIIMSAGRADMVRALQLTTVRAFVWIACNQCVVAPAIVPAGAGNFILWDSHVSTSISRWAHRPIQTILTLINKGAEQLQPICSRGRENTAEIHLCKSFL